MVKQNKTVSDIQPVSVFTLFKKSYDIVLSNIQIFALVYGVPLIFSVLSSLNQPDTQTIETNLFPTYSSPVAAFVAILVIASLVFTVMAVGLTLKTAKKQKPTFNELWDFTRKYFFRMFGLWFIMGIIIILGFLAFIVPGLIFLRRYFLAPYVLADKDLTIFEALKESSRISKPYSKSVWTLIGMSIIIALIANPRFSIVAVIASSLISIAFSVAPALRYYELKKIVK